MRFCKFNEEGSLEEDRKVESLQDLITILSNATYSSWLEDLGQPNCYHDLCMWKRVGSFLSKIKQLPLAGGECTIPESEVRR